MNKIDEIKINHFMNKEIYNKFTKNIKYLYNFLKRESIFMDEIKVKDRKLVLKYDFFVFDNFIIEYLYGKINSLNDDKENILKRQLLLRIVCFSNLSCKRTYNLKQKATLLVLLLEICKTLILFLQKIKFKNN